MASIQESGFTIMKYDPVWQKFSQTKFSGNARVAQAANLLEPESMIQMNERAKEYPFCIMYHIKEHDPL